MLGILEGPQISLLYQGKMLKRPFISQWKWHLVFWQFDKYHNESYWHLWIERETFSGADKKMDVLGGNGEAKSHVYQWKRNNWEAGKRQFIIFFSIHFLKMVEPISFLSKSNCPLYGYPKCDMWQNVVWIL